MAIKGVGTRNRNRMQMGKNVEEGPIGWVLITIIIRI